MRWISLSRNGELVPPTWMFSVTLNVFNVLSTFKESLSIQPCTLQNIAHPKLNQVLRQLFQLYSLTLRNDWYIDSRSGPL